MHNKYKQKYVQNVHLSFGSRISFLVKKSGYLNGHFQRFIIEVTDFANIFWFANGHFQRFIIKIIDLVDIF